MFIGHFAVGFASKRIAPKASLGALIAAPLALDLLWPFFLLSGAEQVRIDPGNTAFTPLDFVSYPYTHSLLTAAGWSVLFALLYWAGTRYASGAMVVGAGVISHWLLDAATHRPDLPLTPGGAARVGLGLWNSIAWTMAIEGAMFAAGVWIYAAFTHPMDRTGRYGFWAMVGFLGLAYLGNAFGPPPENATFLAWFSLSIWIFPVWAFWFDRHRAVTSAGQSAP